MKYELIPLSQLDEDGMKQLAGLHHSVIHTLLSDLGVPMVLRYYQIARLVSDVIGFYAITPSGEILGWAMGSSHPDRINSRLQTPFVWFMIQMFRLLFTRPLVLWQLISSVLSALAQEDIRSNSIELTYIGVVLNQRSKGLGKKLLNAFIEASREKGYRSVILSVEIDNKPAIALYEKSGFRVIKTYSEGRYQRHRMELTFK